jgi:tetratricopeptide (TPR) repeat protein
MATLTELDILKRIHRCMSGSTQTDDNADNDNSSNAKRVYAELTALKSVAHDMPIALGHVLLARSKTLVRLWRHREALYDINAALRIQPHSVDFMLMRAFIFMDFGQDQFALDILEHIRLCFMTFSTYQHVGAVAVAQAHIYIQQRQYERAITTCADAITTIVNNHAGMNRKASLHCNRSAALIQLGRYEEALHDIAQAASIPADNITQHTRATLEANQGLAYERLWNSHQARECYRCAINIEPTFVPSGDNALTALFVAVLEEAAPPYAAVSHCDWRAIAQQEAVHSATLQKVVAREWSLIEDLQYATPSDAP